ncbi:MAG: hypothetical protein KGY69_14595 [Bacteroidales bacterium]|nr:hypothetical protein [Bacteroidales bacterium]
MVDLPAKSVVEGTLEIGTIYYLEAQELIRTYEPHYFIVIYIDDEDIYLLKGTSRKESIETRIERFYGNDFSGVVCLEPIDSEYELTKTTYVNCHDPISIRKRFLIEKRENSVLQYKGKINRDYWLQIKYGITNSKYTDLAGIFAELPEDFI